MRQQKQLQAQGKATNTPQHSKTQDKDMERLLSQHDDDQKNIEGLRCGHVRACADQICLHPYLVLLFMRVGRQRTSITVDSHLNADQRLFVLFRADCNLFRPMANIASGGCTSP